MFNPLNTLAGRMVLVTVLAVAISYALTFVIYSNERGAALQRAAENALIERVAYAGERLRAAPAQQRPLLHEDMRDRGFRLSISAAPAARQADVSGPAGRIARGIAERLPGAEVRVDPRPPPLMFDHSDAMHRGEHGPARRLHDELGRFEATPILVSVRLDANTWMNVRARLPRPRPLPSSVWVAALATVLIVGFGAALVSRQIGKPLADLARAAQALGAGKTAVRAPVTGPEDVRRASNAFNAMAERLSRQIDRQRQMLWALSHDLRTPITAIRLRAELLDDEAERQRLLASIQEMEQLTEQALALARAGASEEMRQNVDLAEIARTLGGELRELGAAITVDADQPVMIECRPNEIARALRNVADNAAKYAGGGAMRVFASGDQAVVEVSDEGPGVSEEQLSRLTEPFYRADPARSSPGAGLGLAIAQAIVEAHAGSLTLQNRSPHGFTATISLPRSVAAA